MPVLARTDAPKPHWSACSVTVVVVTLLSSPAAAEPTPRSGESLSRNPSCGPEYHGPFERTINQLRCAIEEDRDLRPEAFYFEPSKVFFLSGNIKVEGEIAEPIFPFQRRMNARDRHFGGFVNKAALTPMWRARILTQYSSPVRVPSFMPKVVTWQTHRLKHRRPGQQWGGVKGRVRMDTLMASVGHHSNGQDGCILAADSAPRCSRFPREIVLNRVNGSFSTNYLEISAFRRLMTLGSIHSEPGGNVRPVRRTIFFGGTVEWHPSFDTLGGALERPYRPVFGPWRLKSVLGYEFSTGLKHLPHVNAKAWVQVINKSRNSDDCGLDEVAAARLANIVLTDPRGLYDNERPEILVKLYRQPCAPRLGWGIDFHLRIGKQIDALNLYLRYYHAQDYYNLAFTHRKPNRVQWGLSFTPGRGKPLELPIIDDRTLREEEQYANDPATWKAYKRYIRKNAISRSSCAVPDVPAP